MSDDLPVVRVADYEIAPGWKLGDIKTCEEANDAIATLTEHLRVLHERRVALLKEVVEHKGAVTREVFRTKWADSSSVMGLIKVKEAALNFAYGIRRDLGGGTPKHKVKGREIIAHRMVTILKEAFPETYEKVELIYLNDPRRQTEKPRV